MLLGGGRHGGPSRTTRSRCDSACVSDQVSHSPYRSSDEQEQPLELRRRPERELMPASVARTASCPPRRRVRASP